MKEIKHKRKYTPPAIEKYIIDNEISLVMMTTVWQPGDGKPDTPPGQDKKGTAAQTTTDSTTNSTFETNPFN